VRSLFTYDAPPPLPISAVNLDLVQNQRLYMADVNFDLRTGLLNIDATYYGAAIAAQQEPYLTYSYESRVTRLTILSGYIITFQAFIDGVPQPPRLRAVYDFYAIRYRVQKPTISCAVVDQQVAGIEQLCPEATISKAQIVSKQLNDPDPAYANIGHRGLSPIQLLGFANSERSVEKQVAYKTRRVAIDAYTADLLIDGATIVN
jgi:hypothetical protein